MHGPCRIAIAFSCLATAAIASLPSPRSAFEARLDPRLPPVLSIQGHLAETERHLRAHPPAGLDSARRAARAARLDDLRAYRLRGDFPRNLDFPDRAIPYFIDARGIACAVGHLMLLSGGAGLAGEIARTRNHVYLPDEKDPRLAEWARANGLTLEECARIQPSYAAKYSDIFDLGFDGAGRPWVATGQGVAMSGYVLSRLGDQGWSTQSWDYMVGFRDFCMVGDRPLVVHHAGFTWNGQTTSLPGMSDAAGGACATAPEGAGFWIGGLAGLRKYSAAGSGTPVLEESVRKGAEALPSDTVHDIAVDGERIWVATSQGLAFRRGQGQWTRVAVPDLTGKHPGGLRVDRAQGAWAGLLDAQPDHRWDYRVAFPMSQYGLIRVDSNGQGTRYHRGNSPLPSDTLYLAAPAKDGGVWLTTPGPRLLHFLPPDRLTVFPAALPTWINALELDAQGRPHVGSYGGGMGSGASGGLFRVEGDDLVSLGHPTGASSLARPDRHDAARRSGWLSLPGAIGDGFRLDLLGRRHPASD